MAHDSWSTPKFQLSVLSAYGFGVKLGLDSRVLEVSSVALAWKMLTREFRANVLSAGGPCGCDQSDFGWTHSACFECTLQVLPVAVLLASTLVYTVRVFSL